MKKKSQKNQDMIIYQTKSGSVELKADITKETIWASQQEIASIFGVQKAAISKHVKNIFETGELNKKSTVSKMETVQTEGRRQVSRKIEMYNLDMIIAIGYRVNSKNATRFRQWATKTLRDYLVRGYAFNKKRIKKNHQEFLKAVESIQNLLPENITLDPASILNLVKEFSSTWTVLDAYDKDSVQSTIGTKRSIKISGEDLYQAVSELRKNLIQKGEATELFAQEREQGSLKGILGNVMQQFGGKDVYPSLEEKAAHLLYFVIKNHPFVDGNKRSGAWSFLWFLRKARVKGSRNINPQALTAITLLVAESKPEKKDQMIALITNFLATQKK